MWMANIVLHKPGLRTLDETNWRNLNGTYWLIRGRLACVTQIELHTQNDSAMSHLERISHDDTPRVAKPFFTAAWVAELQQLRFHAQQQRLGVAETLRVRICVFLPWGHLAFVEIGTSLADVRF
ncbi:hypothetical protein R5R35_004874 [Gryllus longicercus]|uniref:Uncharacterized protein n=1 Tax=Gryllus longicercus TaxID=2509291 RepID=A0AAN9VAD8_9ORTH